MTITSLLFLFCFLPIALAIYHIVRDEAKEWVLLALNLIFYSLASLQYFGLFAVIMCLTVTLGRAIDLSDNRVLRKILFVIGVLVNLSILGYYKYTDFAVTAINGVFKTSIGLKNLLLPVGISFYTFKAISYLVDTYKNRIDLQKSSPVHDALYLSFFFQIQSGPLTRYADSFCVAKEDRKAYFSDGVWRFMIGFNKKILLANVLSNISTEIFSKDFNDFSTMHGWVGSIIYSLQLYYDFAGYSDMAIGISQMFGYSCAENFDHPYMTESVTKFWRRWHISLGNWFRDYIYIPMGGSRTKHKYQIYRNLFVVWILTGIWHGASWNFVLWGIGYFVLIVFEKFTGLPDRLKSKAGRIFYRLFSLVFINCQWVIFRSDGAIDGLRYIKRMFIPTFNTIADRRVLFLVKDYLAFILIAIVLCFPIVPGIRSRLKGAGKQIVYDGLTGLVIMLSFLLALSMIVAGLNNPFVYIGF